MPYTYEVLINLGPRKFLQPLDEVITNPFVFTYRGTIEGVDDRTAAWNVVSRHNRDDRPDGQLGPSFSAGDAITIIDGIERTTYVSVRGTDLVQVSDHLQVERTRLWYHVVHHPEQASPTHRAVPVESLDRFATELSDVVQLISPVVAPAIKDRIESVALRLAPRHFLPITNPES